MNRLSADLLLLLCAFFWGTAFYFQKTAMEHMGPMLFVALRGAIAFVALAPFAYMEHRRRKPAGDSVAMLTPGAGLLFFLGAFLQQAGLVTATVTNAGLLTSLYVVVTPLLIWAVRRRAPSMSVWLAVLLAFLGAWMLGGGGFGAFSPGDWLVASSTIFWAGHILMTDQAARHDRPLTFTCLQFAIVALLAAPVAILTEPIALSAILAAWDSLLYLGVVSGALTFSLLAVALRYAPTAEATVLMSLEIVFAALVGFALLGERLTPLSWTGAGLMFCAVLAVQLLRPKQAVEA